MSTDDLVKKIKSRKINDRLEAVQRIVSLNDSQWVPTLVSSLQDRSNLVIAAVVKGLSKMTVPNRHKLIRPVIDAYWHLVCDGKKRDPGCIARLAILTALQKWEAIEAHDVLFDAIDTYQVERSGNGLEDMAVPLRVQAAAALGALRPPGALTALTLALFDVEPKVELPPQEKLFAMASVRKAAAQALGILADPGAVAVLVLKLRFKGQELDEIIIECMDSLVALDSGIAMRYVTPMLFELSESLVVGAATALAHTEAIYHAQIVKLLLDVIEDTSSTCRAGIALALASMRSTEAEEGLKTLLDHSDEEVRLAAQQALSFGVND